MKPVIPRAKLGNDFFADDILTVKKCIPFLESMSAGYTIPLWSDLKIEKLPTLLLRSKSGKILNDKPLFLRTREKPEDFLGKFASGEIIDAVEVGDVQINATHPELSNNDVGSHIRSQVGLEGRFKGVDKLFKLFSPWTIKTSKGYSCFFKNPSNDFSNPITLFEGVVDTDTYHNAVAFPFFVSDLNVDEYIIKAGTPICQVIPFKREQLNATFSVCIDERQPHNTFFAFADYYRKNNWHKRKIKND